MDFTIRRSTRARHVWLRLSDSGELVVVVPRRFDASRVPGIIASNRAWIERASKRAAERRTEALQTDRVLLPDRIHLNVDGSDWAVRYRPTASASVRVDARAGPLLDVSGAVEDREACRRALVRWLRRAANARLVAMLGNVAGERGFTVRRVAVRIQRTRWASCSRNGTVSLNVKLLFVAPELARHVMLHELCHTLRMDHSKRFWTLLASHDAEWSSHRRELRAAWRRVPAWVTTPLSQ